MEKFIKYLLFSILIIIVLTVAVPYFLSYKTMDDKFFRKIDGTGELIELPKPRFDSSTSVEEALLERRSVREYKNEPLSLSEISQLLWSAQGITNEKGYRTAPSAGALYPLELYVVVGDVKNLAAGVYKYIPGNHALKNVGNGDKRESLESAAISQSMVGEAPITLVFTAVYERTKAKYGERGVRYVWIEVGHAAQNVYLQAESLSLGAVVMGAFHENKVKEICNTEENEEPIYIMSIGNRIYN